ncbi:MAG TPA: hypothetical protein VJ742_12595 [Nitrososphaera sp.]|nr:hypothetical protein [Nitrososphaera sp.]
MSPIINQHWTQCFCTRRESGEALLFAIVKEGDEKDLQAALREHIYYYGPHDVDDFEFKALSFETERPWGAEDEEQMRVRFPSASCKEA